jgi:hypothetical protein
LVRSRKLVVLGSFKCIVQRKPTGVNQQIGIQGSNIGSNDRCSNGDAESGIFILFLRAANLDIAKKTFAACYARNITFYANIRRCCKSHVAPFNFFLNSTSTDVHFATESLAPYKWCHQHQKGIFVFPNGTVE